MPTPKKPIRLWPEGGELFAEICKRNDPTLTDRQLFKLAVLWLDTPATPVDEATWDPDGVGRDPCAVLIKETTVAALLFQAWSDRTQWALLCAPDAPSLRNYRNAVRVLKTAVRFLPEA